MYLDFANICSVAKALDAKKQLALHKESVEFGFAMPSQGDIGTLDATPALTLDWRR